MNRSTISDFDKVKRIFECAFSSTRDEEEEEEALITANFHFESLKHLVSKPKWGNTYALRRQILFAF